MGSKIMVSSRACLALQKFVKFAAKLLEKGSPPPLQPKRQNETILRLMLAQKTSHSILPGFVKAYCFLAGRPSTYTQRPTSKKNNHLRAANSSFGEQDLEAAEPSLNIHFFSVFTQIAATRRL
jgi:hypothetical protein